MLKLNGYEEQQTKGNEKNQCIKGETLEIYYVVTFPDLTRHFFVILAE